MTATFTKLSGLLPRVAFIGFLFSVTTVSGQSVTFSELNYNSDSTTNSGSWVELYNYGTTTLDLTGWYLKDDNNANTFLFPNGTTITAGNRLVVVTDVAKFTEQYPGVSNYVGEIPFGFGNGGDQVRLFDNTFSLKVFMEYTDTLPWPEAADGTGRTLELIDQAQTPDDPANWFVGCMGGSPGTAFTTCDDPIVFDEINYNSDTLLNAGDWVELYNRSSSGINLTGYSLKDGNDDNIYFFPTNTQIAAGGRLVLVHDITLFTTRHPTVTNYLGTFAFNLSNDGEVIRLFNAQGKLSYSVVFDDDGDWPSGADGDGYTLELLDPVANVNSSTDWFDGCIEGSPGFAYDPDCNIGVFDPEPKQALTVLHNLTSDYVEIIIPASGAYSTEDMIIYNGMGEVVLKTKAAGSSLSVNVSRFPAGLYIVSLKNDRHFVTGKFLVQ